MKIVEKYFKSFIIGIVFATFFPIGIALFSTSKEVIITTRGNGMDVVLLQYFVCGMFGPISLLLAKITFEQEKLSLLVQSILHCLGVALYFVFASIINVWFDSAISFFFASLGFVVIYASIYLLSYFKMKKEVKETNDVLLNK